MSTHFSRHSGGSGQPLLSTQKPCVSSSSQGHVPLKVHSVPGLHGDTETYPEDTESKHVPHAHDAPGAALPTDGLCPFAPRSFGKHRNPERSRQTVVCWLWAGTAGHCVQKLLRQAAFECSAPRGCQPPHAWHTRSSALQESRSGRAPTRLHFRAISASCRSHSDLMKGFI